MVAVFGCRTRALGRLGSVAAAPGLYITDSVVVEHGLVKKCSILPAALQAFLHSPCFLSKYCLIAHNVKSKYENETFTHTSKVLLRIPLGIKGSAAVAGYAYACWKAGMTAR